MQQHAPVRDPYFIHSSSFSVLSLVAHNSYSVLQSSCLFLSIVYCHFVVKYSRSDSCKCCRVFRDLQLKRPIYSTTATYGHFGRSEFSWEQPKILQFWSVPCGLSDVAALFRFCYSWLWEQRSLLGICEPIHTFWLMWYFWVYLFSCVVTGCCCCGVYTCR